MRRRRGAVRGALRAAVGLLALVGAPVLPGAGCGGGTGQGARDGAAGVDADAGAGSDGDASADAIDCPASCDRIAAICAGMSTIDENWLSICRQNCGVRAAVQPDEARTEVACTAAAPDCTTAILCSVDPLGGDR
jgi:hypothetical protein